MPEFNHPMHNADQVLIERRALRDQGLSHVSVRTIVSRKWAVSSGQDFIFDILRYLNIRISILKNIEEGRESIEAVATH